MKHSSSILATIALFGFLAACSSSSDGPPFVRSKASSDLNEFQKYVNLPERPLTLTFETLYRAKPSRTPGPSDWFLTAVLTFDPAALQRLEVNNQKQRDPILLDANEVRPWFPKTIKDSLLRSGDQGFRFPGPAYHALSFTKPPLNDGEFAVLDAAGAVFLQLDCCGPMADRVPGK